MKKHVEHFFNLKRHQLFQETFRNNLNEFTLKHNLLLMIYQSKCSKAPNKCEKKSGITASDNTFIFYSLCKFVVAPLLGDFEGNIKKQAQSSLFVILPFSYYDPSCTFQHACSFLFLLLPFVLPWLCFHSFLLWCSFLELLHLCLPCFYSFLSFSHSLSSVPFPSCPPPASLHLPSPEATAP